MTGDKCLQITREKTMSIRETILLHNKYSVTGRITLLDEPEYVKTSIRCLAALAKV